VISKNHRFHGSKSLRRVYQNGQTVRGPLFSIRYSLNERRQTHRVAVVVSRKVHKSAVGRNRMRRRLYGAVRQAEKDIIRPYDIVITVFSENLLDSSPAELGKQLHSQLQLAGILARRVNRD
jgi:ribonuclease P protein component